jgi:hypothetical protein
LQLQLPHASWPGVSNLMDLLKDQIGEGTLQFEFNPSDPFNSMLGYDLGLTLTLDNEKFSLSGPPSLISVMRDLDLSTEEVAEYALAAQDDIDVFTEALDDLETGETAELELSEENLTALLTQEVDEQFEDLDNLGVSISGMNVNINDDGLVLSTVISLPEDTGLGLPEGLAGSSLEIGFDTELVVDDEGNATMQITGVDLGGLPPSLLEEFGLDTEELNASLAEAEIDFGEIFDLPEGALSGLTLSEGEMLLLATGQ